MTPVKDEKCTLDIPFSTRIPLVGEDIRVNDKEYKVLDIKHLSNGEDFATYEFTVQRPKSLIVLMGAPGSGKTTFCQTSLPDYHRVSQDDMGKKAYLKIFQKMVQDGVREIVVDRMNQDSRQREKFLNLAKRNGYSTTIIWLQTPDDICNARIENRLGHKYTARDCRIALSYYYKSLESPLSDEADRIIFKG